MKRNITILLFLSIFQYGVSQNQDQIQLANEYYLQGDLEKAKLLYEELAESPYNIQLISANYLTLLKSTMDFQSAEDFLKSVIKTFPSNMQYKANLAGVYLESGDSDKLKSYISKLRKESKSNPFQSSIIAQYLVNEQLYYDAIDFFKDSREARGNTSVHALEMAAI